MPVTLNKAERNYIFPRNKRNMLLNAVYKNQLSLGRMQTHSCCTGDWDQGLKMHKNHLDFPECDWTEPHDEATEGRKKQRESSNILRLQLRPAKQNKPAPQKQNRVQRSGSILSGNIHFNGHKLYQSWGEKEINSCHSLCTVENEKHEEGASAQKGDRYHLKSLPCKVKMEQIIHCWRWDSSH